MPRQDLAPPQKVTAERQRHCAAEGDSILPPAGTGDTGQANLTGSAGQSAPLPPCVEMAQNTPSSVLPLSLSSSPPAFSAASAVRRLSLPVWRTHPEYRQALSRLAAVTRAAANARDLPAEP